MDINFNLFYFFIIKLDLYFLFLLKIRILIQYLFLRVKYYLIAYFVLICLLFELAVLKGTSHTILHP